MKLSLRGHTLLKILEGFRTKAYLDGGGVWTIGYGFTDNVKEGDTITLEEAESRLLLELVEYEVGVWAATGGDVTQNEFDALVIFAWNVGVPQMQGSTVIKAHNRGDKPAASRAFGLWNKITVDNKKVADKGLTRRRAIEAAFYLESDDQDDTPPPQVVEPEKPLTSSTTMIAAGTGLVATFTQMADHIGKLKTSVEGIGDWLTPAMLVVTVVAIGWVVYERFQNRNRGSV